MNETGRVRVRSLKKTTVYLDREHCVELMRRTGTTSFNAAINKVVQDHLREWLKKQRSEQEATSPAEPLLARSPN